MPVPEQRPSWAFVWIVSSFLFVAIVTGGAFLVIYMFSPAIAAAHPWLPLAGISLVFVPWLFWFTTYVYRIFTRSCFGPRAIRRPVPPAGGNGSVATATSVEEATVTADAMDPGESPEVSPDGDVRHAPLGGAIVLGEDKPNASGANQSNSSPTNSDDSVLSSRESETPLTLSMVS